jgi:cation/acetate symporter
MTIQTWTFLIVGATFALYIFLAFVAKARSTQDFYVAGGHVPPLANGMATAADWMSAASFISMAGLISFLGYDGSVYLMGWTGGYVLLALLLAPYLRKFGKFTVPDFVGDRYDSQSPWSAPSSSRSPMWPGRCAASGSSSAASWRWTSPPAC